MWFSSELIYVECSGLCTLTQRPLGNRSPSSSPTFLGYGSSSHSLNEHCAQTPVLDSLSTTWFYRDPSFLACLLCFLGCGWHPARPHPGPYGTHHVCSNPSLLPRDTVEIPGRNSRVPVCTKRKPKQPPGIWLLC